MMYNQVLKDILMEYERKRDNAVYKQRINTKEVYRKIPKIRAIDKEIWETGLLMSKAVIENPNDYQENLQKVKKQIEKLRMEKAYLLTENNIPLDYLDINYECSECEDTGYLPNGEKCNCLIQALINKAYKMSNIENVLKKENFDTFNINVFPDEPFEEQSMTPRENMKYISNICVDYVNNFNDKNEVQKFDFYCIQ